MNGLDFFPPKAQEKAITEYLEGRNQALKQTDLVQPVIRKDGDTKCRMLNTRLFSSTHHALYLRKRSM
jgi:hypothetical protein